VYFASTFLAGGGGTQSPKLENMLVMPPWLIREYSLSMNRVSGVQCFSTTAVSPLFLRRPFSTVGKTEVHEASQLRSAARSPAPGRPGTVQPMAPLGEVSSSICAQLWKKAPISKLAMAFSAVRALSPVQPSLSSRWSQSVGIIIRLVDWPQYRLCCTLLSSGSEKVTLPASSTALRT